MLKQRVTGDYLQTSAILDKNFDVISAVNDINNQDLERGIESVKRDGKRLKTFPT